MQKNLSRGFSLIELFVVILIISILASLAYPVYTSTQERARATQDMSNLRQIGLAAQMYFNDHDGYRTGVAQKWKEATLTLAYLPAKEWEIRAEVRADKSDQSAFLKSDGVTSTSTQRSFGLEALYKF